jgi:hypothetical protein
MAKTLRCRGVTSAAEIKKALNHPSLAVRAGVETFIEEVMVKENK